VTGWLRADDVSPCPDGGERMSLKHGCIHGQTWVNEAIHAGKHAWQTRANTCRDVLPPHRLFSVVDEGIHGSTPLLMRGVEHVWHSRDCSRLPSAQTEGVT
jgi:hypothetical protein